jgi:predicted TIM-barrel fold metal-dependent hydrolase
MWATDWPIIEDRSTYDKALTVVRDEMKFFNQDDLRWVLSDTVQKVWKFAD